MGSPAEPAEQGKCISMGCHRGAVPAGAGDGARGEVVWTTMFDSKLSKRSRRGGITLVRSCKVRGGGCGRAGEATWSALTEALRG